MSPLSGQETVNVTNFWQLQYLPFTDAAEIRYNTARP